MVCWSPWALALKSLLVNDRKICQLLSHGYPETGHDRRIDTVEIGKDYRSWLFPPSVVLARRAGCYTFLSPPPACHLPSTRTVALEDGPLFALIG